MNYLKTIATSIPVSTGLKRLSTLSPDKVKTGRFENLKNYWITLAADYKEAVMDVIKLSRESPVKASTYISGLLGLGYVIKNNPDELEYKNTLQTCLNESALLGSSIKNSDTDKHFQYVVTCFNQGLIRRFNFGLGSMLWVADHRLECGGYEATTSYLKPKWLTFHERIIDVGFCGEWWNLRNKYKDFDVSLEEWSDDESIEATT